MRADEFVPEDGVSTARRQRSLEAVPAMKVVIAPDKLKGSLSAPEAARAIARGLAAADPHAEVDLAPMADGGEGTVEALVAATGGLIREVTVTGPLGEPV